MKKKLYNEFVAIILTAAICCPTRNEAMLQGDGSSLYPSSPEEQPSFIEAVQKGNLKSVKKLANFGNIYQQDESGNCVRYIAKNKGHAAVLAHLNLVDELFLIKKKQRTLGDFVEWIIDHASGKESLSDALTNWCGAMKFVKKDGDERLLQLLPRLYAWGIKTYFLCSKEEIPGEVSQSKEIDAKATKKIKKKLPAVLASLLSPSADPGQPFETCPEPQQLKRTIEYLVKHYNDTLTFKPRLRLCNAYKVLLNRGLDLGDNKLLSEKEHKTLAGPQPVKFPPLYAKAFVFRENEEGEKKKDENKNEKEESINERIEEN